MGHMIDMEAKPAKQLVLEVEFRQASSPGSVDQSPTTVFMQITKMCLLLKML